MAPQQMDDIQEDIEATRAAIREKLDLLDTRVRQKVDLHYYIGRRPWQLLGGATALGFAIGMWRAARWHMQPIDGFTAPAYRPQPRWPLDMLRMFAVALLASLVYDSIRGYIPWLRDRADGRA